MKLQVSLHKNGSIVRTYPKNQKLGYWVRFEVSKPAKH